MNSWYKQRLSRTTAVPRVDVMELEAQQIRCPKCGHQQPQAETCHYCGIVFHKDWKDFINIRDLCVIWGNNVSSKVYREMEFSNGTWTCWAYWPNGEVASRFDMNQLSNNHLLAHDPQVREDIMEAEPGDLIGCEGMLARYSHSNGAFERGTSTTRTDSGNGACETVFVTNFRIIQKANRGRRRLYGFSVVALVLSLAGLVAILFLAPVRRR